MGTYIAVVSLMQDLEQLLNSYELLFASTPVYDSQTVFSPFTKKQIDLLYQTVSLMDSFLTDSSGESYNNKIINQKLEKKIKDVAYKAGKYIDFWAALYLPDPEFLFGRATGGGPTLTETTENMKDLDFQASTGTVLPREHETMVGRLIGHPPQLKVVSIIGMVGIGKTTFAKVLYDDPLVVKDFYVRVWVTVSREYQLRRVLICILQFITSISHEIYGKRNEELREQVYESLKGKRYLIVLDDICDRRVWDDLNRAFPDDRNGSRIILTSWLKDVVVHASQDSSPCYLHRLDKRESSQLLHECLHVSKFADPLVADAILNECQGLPLAIVVAAGFLRGNILKPKMIQRGSNKIAQILGSLVTKEADHCRNIMALGYNHLPDHLKKCLLHMGNFPQGYEISAKKLTCLWLAEGFIRRTMHQSLGEVAKGYLETLADRGLIMVRRDIYDRRIKTCYIHDLMREICLRESKKQKFLHLINPRSYLHVERKVTLTEIAQEIDSINEELKKIHGKKKVEDLETASSKDTSFTPLSPSRRTLTAKGKLVGLEKDLMTMLDSLTGHQSQLKVFAIIGMAGIGKTTFSRKLYDDPLVMYYFHVRVWITVSQQYQVTELLLGILHCTANFSDEIYGKTNEELKELVYKILKGKRYLIVLDDMWDTNAWDDLRLIFPDDKNGSRILLTSRLRDVAVSASQDTPPHCLRCLSVNESWELLSSKIFGDESCPVELLEIGKHIASRCQGLPLAIVVVGGLLSKMNKRLDIWEEVAQSVGSLVMEEGKHCQNILALSYNHLPDRLKACFLYLGVFPEDYEISVKKLIWLWVAEGFIMPSMLKRLEEVAEDYVEDLVGRSLIMVKRKSSDGRIKTCYIHDLMRELCLRESEKQNLLRVINKSGQLQEKNQLDNLLLHFDIKQHPRRLSFHSSIQKYIHKTSLPYTRSVLCFEKISLSDCPGYLGADFNLLKVLDIMNIQLTTFPTDILYRTRLKLLALTVQNYFNMMYLLAFRSLQTLIFDWEWDGHLEDILWEMLELRHFHLKRICLPYSQLIEFQSASTSVSELPDEVVPPRDLTNLQSLCTIRPVSCTKKVFLSMPNLKKLGIHEFEEDNRFRGWFKNLVHLQELEKLKYVFSNPFASSVFKPDRLPSWDSFPPKLVKLTLSGTSLPWEDMLKISMLPKLEVLKLRNFAFSGAVWKSREEGFLCLKFLLIGSTDLEIWEADGTPFPSLQHLVLRHCRSLKEIPYGIGEAPLLENIELHCCKDSAVRSARELLEEQQSQGNDLLTIRVSQG